MGRPARVSEWARANQPPLASHRVQLRDASRVSPAFERCLQPHPYDFERKLFRNHALPNRKYIGVVMLA